MPRLGRSRPASNYKLVREAPLSGSATVALTTPNLALAAPAPAVSGSATVALTTPNLALAAPLVTPVPGQVIALTTPNVALAAPLLSPSASVTVALTTPNLALAAPAVIPAESSPFPDPRGQLGLMLELNAGGTWTDVTGDWDHGPAVIGRGHPDESTTVAPSQLNGIQLTNATARYSPDNVMSDLWPWVVQNMPGRISVPAARNYLRLEADQSDCALAADNTAMHVTGSTEVRWYGRLTDWQGCFLTGRLDSTSTGSWFLVLRGDGTLRFGWWDSGGTEWQVASDAPLPFVSGDFAVRVLLDATVGTVAFYTSSSIDGTWALLGDAFAVTGGAATSVRAGSDPLRAGWSPAGFSDIGSGASVQCHGRVYEVRLYNGLGGSIVADGLFSAQAAGTTSWTGTDGLSWSVSGGAEVSSRNYRLHFESSELPQDEPEYNPDKANDTSVETDALVPLVGGGLLRRLGQRAPNVSSPLYRAVLAQPGLVAYWPMEDAASATSFGSATGGTPMTWGGGPPVLASNSQDFACSGPLPVMGSNGNGASLFGAVPAYTTGGGAAWTVGFLLDVGTLPASGEPTVCQVDCIGGLAAYIVFAVTSAGFVQLVAYDNSLNVLADTGLHTWAGLQSPMLWIIQAAESGSNVEFTLASVAPGESVGSFVTATTSATGIPGYVAQVLPVTGGGYPDTVLGHVQVTATAPSVFALAPALAAHYGEPAGTRFARLCAENGITCRTRGNLAATVPMGAQQTGTLTTLLQACADADQGVWAELRQVLGWGYVTRAALYNQVATAIVSYLSDHLSMWSTPPTRDDQVAENDVTYTNDSGSSARMFAAAGQPISGGRMGTANPVNGGIGTYAQSHSVSVASDSQLTDLAGWRLHIGTTDQARLPGIMIDLANTQAVTDGIYQQVLDLDLGDLLVIQNPPRRLGFMPVTQLAQALTETLWHDTLSIGIAGVPELPYEVWQLSSRVAPNAAVLSAGVSATATSWSVAADAGDSTQLWSVSAGDYPQNWVVDGEEVTCTAMSGSSSPQTATVIRSVNGVTKSHLASAAITLWPPPVIGL